MADVELAEIDPVCGMKVKPENAAAAVEHAGRTWYFCAQGCKTKFEADPGKYDGSHSRSSDIHRRCSQNDGVRAIHLSHASRSALLKTGVLPEMRHGSGANPASRSLGTHRVHLPHASANRARRPGQLSDLWHGP